MAAAPPHSAMRPFGHSVDLDLDFSQSDRPGLVTGILTQCGEHQDPALWWSQSVGVRTAALLRLVALTEGRSSISLIGYCTSAGCGEPFDFDLPLLPLPDGGSDSGPIRVQLADGRALNVRRPTGEDLRAWREAQPASRADAVRLMLGSLVLDGEAGSDDEAAVSASIAAADPLVDFTVACCCPACGTSNEVAVDLETVALMRLVGRQRALLQEVHRFASHYGWTESEVMAVPPARRARYLALIGDER